jgi:DNA-binding GntR family transcriptional regulator
MLEVLRKMILEGDLPPGHRLVEMDLAGQMGVSRAPVREAIRRLEQDGLVEIFPNRGAVVVGIAEDEMGAIYETRAAIEAQAFTRARELITPEQLAELERLVATMGEHVRRGATAEVIDADLAFHRLVLEASGYAVLRRVWDSLDGIMRVRMMQALERNAPSSRYFLDATVSSHTKLLEALRDGQPSRAAELAREHLLGVAARMIDGSQAEDPQT